MLLTGVFVMKKLLTKKEVCSRVGYSAAHIARLEKEGRFPERIKPGKLPNSKAFWLESEIDKWIDDHVGSRS